ncbi:GIY-YIG nuclease family protein [Candidatus Dojkabacteria bacterium]|uniref:GIY-YIG nuclease family protein n=1 Tax=Candidatus Dojkabacteria bacterium TaxID=2099670 RepID=A0A955LB39_9BACT|nr:GIY-YIG nuclease family protein [Candidatus Dojkabacteria bacterium]
MRYTVYIIKSDNGKYYIGYTSQLEERLVRHNQGRERYTKKYLPWILVYTKNFDIKSDALKYEKYLKSLKSSKVLRSLEKEWRGGSSTG